MPAPSGEDPIFKPNSCSVLVVGGKLLWMHQGAFPPWKGVPRDVSCAWLLLPNNNEYKMYYKYGGDMPFFRKHPSPLL